MEPALLYTSGMESPTYNGQLEVYMAINIIDLQRFAEGEAGGSSPVSTGGMSSNAAAVPSSGSNQAASVSIRTSFAGTPISRRPIRPVPGTQPAVTNMAEATAPNETANTPTEAPQRASFDDLIRGEYKSDYEAKIQAQIADRLKGSRAREEASAPILQALAEKYGKDVTDLNGIRSAMESENSDAIRQKADDLGVSVDTARKLDRLKRMEDARANDLKKAQQEALVHSHYDDLQSQAAELKQMFPGFDLQAELKDPRFFRWTGPDGDMSLKEAYMALHHDEIMAAGMQYATERAKAQVSAAVAAGQARPREAGLSSTPAVEVRKNPLPTTKAERDELKRRVALGEQITFDK